MVINNVAEGKMFLYLKKSSFVEGNNYFCFSAIIYILEAKKNKMTSTIHPVPLIQRFPTILNLAGNHTNPELAKKIKTAFAITVMYVINCLSN